MVIKSDYSQNMQLSMALQIQTQVNVSEFKATCLRLLEQVRQTGEPLEILKNGVPLAVVYPPPAAERKAAFGALKDSLRGPVGDLISPVDAQWEALD
jgi:prevent-host-death family protein